jgi:hypothetical protein
MPGLATAECYRKVKPVDIGPALGMLPRLRFVNAQHKGNYAGGLSADVVTKDGFTPELRDWIASLNIGGRPGRQLIRRLAPRQGIPRHTDEWMPGELDWRRFQIPLVTHPDIKMRWPDDDAEVHLEPGWIWEVRYDRPHEVVNPTDTARVHLQIDQIEATI